MTQNKPTAKDIRDAYNLLVRNMDDDAQAADGDRAYGGILRAGKGALVESIAKTCIEISWRNLGGKQSRLSFEKMPILVPLRKDYLKRIKDQKIRAHILQHIENYVYKFKTDIHVNIDGQLVIGTECKAYTENAMLKRIAIDSMFLKHAHPSAHNVLFQFESQLGGDYSDLSKKIHYGSYPTHTILSYFEDVDLHIITLLEGERKVDKPIHKKGFFKTLNRSALAQAIKIFEDLLRDRI